MHRHSLRSALIRQDCFSFRNDPVHRNTKVIIKHADRCGGPKALHTDKTSLRTKIFFPAMLDRCLHDNTSLHLCGQYFLSIGSILQVNQSFQAKYKDLKNVTFFPIGHLFLEDDGTISKEIMPDYLHLSEEGYQRWADAIVPTVSMYLNRKSP